MNGAKLHWKPSQKRFKRILNKKPGGIEEMYNKKLEKSILFMGKEQDPQCNKALDFCLNNFSDVTAYLGSWGDPFPEESLKWVGDYIISYLSRWVIPEKLLKKARLAAFNFHPGSPDYPGIGCLNFALYEEALEYGVTCHHMKPEVDTGSLIAVKRFPVFSTDSVATLLTRTHDIQLVLFYEVMSWLLLGKELPLANEKWTRRPFTRKEFNQLMKIEPNLPPDEIARRVRATSFGIWQPTVEIAGFTFKFKPEEGDR